ncbi:hypothetical protein [Kitasatospora sp. NPDC085879]|uniref:hypothetical protein n=1 Tax=Kitasatospora sp. NPDC085879 TaxID=3154769 RepID=UPI003442AC3E
MPPNHAPRRSRIVFHAPAARQIAKLTEAETHRLDRALVAVSLLPDIGELRRDVPLRDYRDETEGVRIIYFATALKTTVIAVYIEV